MKVLIPILLLLIIASCGSKERPRNVCHCDSSNKVLAYISDNLQASNNMSDEEMEDVIRELKHTAVQFYCETRVVWIDHNGYVDYQLTKLDSCEKIIEYY